MAAQFSGRQPSTVALDIGISTIRLALPSFCVLLLQELISREFERNFHLISLTYPRPTHHFLLGRFSAVFFMGLALLILLATLLAGMTTFIGHSYTQATSISLGFPYILTIALIALDLLVVLAIGTLLAVTTTTPSFVLIGTIGFTLAARSYSEIIALLTHDGTLVRAADTYQSSLSLLGYLLPDLAALDVRMISLYGEWQFLPDDLLARIFSTLAYITALLALSVWTLNRRKPS